MCSTYLKKEKKSRILESAYELFMTKGYRNTKISDVAEAAGIGKSTVYEYFESKESLLMNIIMADEVEYFSVCSKALEEDISVKEKIVKLIHIEDKYAEKNGSRILKIFAMMGEENGGIPKEVMSKIHELWGKIYGILVKLLEKGKEQGEFRDINTEMTAVVLMGMVGSYMNVKHLLGKTCEMQGKIDTGGFSREQLTDIIFRGIEM